MELKIGENIKRSRKSKGLTQEQLSELLNISCAAVSKWESGDTYPDITMIIPLARIFEISVDDLMGYDEAKAEEDIADILDKYQNLQRVGKFNEAISLITKARKEYPNDYRIMNVYMWCLAGGSADNNPKVLLEHYDEFVRICDCILNGCTDNHIRFEALTMKAKLLHAKGHTEKALTLINDLPNWYQSSEQKTEQLFSKDSAEFRYWVRKNLYELADFAADKWVKAIFFEDTMILDEKVEKIESIGDRIATMYSEAEETVFIVMCKSIYGRLANDLTFRGGKEKDIIRIREKSLKATEMITELSRSDHVLFDYFCKPNGINNLLKWTVDYYRFSENKPVAKLRDNQEYMAMLNKFIK